MMTAAKLGLAVPRPEPAGTEGGQSGKPKTPQEALKEAATIALRYYSADGKVRGGELQCRVAYKHVCIACVTGRSWF